MLKELVVWRSMDAKFGFDDNADFRQKDVFELRDKTQEDPQEVEAAEVSYPITSLLSSTLFCDPSPPDIATDSLDLLVRAQLYQARRRHRMPRKRRRSRNGHYGRA